MALHIPFLTGADLNFRFRDGRIEVMAGGQVIAVSPREGLWSIACDWREGWPTDWSHGTPGEVVTSGDWTILTGEIKACGGTWILEDAYRMEGNFIRGIRRFHWKGSAPAPRVTLSVRFEAPGEKANVLLPGLIYYGNPSGAASGRVPVYNAKPGEEALFEEHRYPMPFAYIELHRAGSLWGAALHSVPSAASHGKLPDQWWSLGVIGRENATEMTLLSGPCASNGKRSVIKAYQNSFAPYANAYLNVPPDTIVEKTFFLEVFPVSAEGSGFNRPLRTSLRIFAPNRADDMPSFADIVRSKYRFAKTRWREEQGLAAFQKFHDRRCIVMGWTGQAEAPGYALQVLADGLDDPDALRMATKSLDFLSDVPFYDGGFHNWYNMDQKSWEREELLCQGQAMFAIARAIEVGKRKSRDTLRWEKFLRKAADVHAARILEEGWRPVSTNEAAFIAPLIKASKLFGVARYRIAAMKAAQHYAKRHLSMREPYWGGTLDACCEDKEAAAIAFQAFLELYEDTADTEHLKWARHACDVMLTYTFVWDVDMPPGRLRDHRLRTRGWTAVSPQNQHLDVWGAFTAPDVYRLGQIDKREDLKELAILMYRSCGQLIDPYGSQGEQIQHTNYLQRNEAPDIHKLRGGYNETWTVFWITAHFLSGASRFLELGVPVWR